MEIIMKSEEELNSLKKELEDVNRKLHELTQEELKEIEGGITPFISASVVRQLKTPTDIGAENISFDVHPGERTGIVGPSGSGNGPTAFL